MTLLKTDNNYEYYLDFFEGKPVKIMRDRKTSEILFDGESVAAYLGYDSMQTMMSQDEVLDCINEHTKETGTSPLRKV